MVEEQFSRTALLLGEEAIERLQNARVAVFGVGGVGGYTAEALARSGVGSIDLIDNDKVCLSNLNRQIIATHQTIGRQKTEVMRERILSINPQAKVYVHNCFFLPETKDEFDFSLYSYVVDAVDTVTAKLTLAEEAKAPQAKVYVHNCFFLPETKDEFDFSLYSYVVDAVDTVTAKLTLAEEAKAAGVPIISSMGAGNKLNPFLFETADIYETSVCPLARVMRRELKKRGIESLKVVYSKEEPRKPLPLGEEETEEGQGKEQDKEARQRRATPGSTAFVPSVAGLLIASEVIRDLTERKNKG